MASGVPVISTLNGALKETISEVALIVDCDKPVSTYNAILALNSSSELRERLISKGHSLANRFRWSEAARQVTEIYRGIVNAN